MENFYRRLRNFKLPKRNELRLAILSFSKKELRIFLGLVALLLISTLGILELINLSFMVKVPAEGGSISEGIVGAPRFVNPVLSFSDADDDMIALIYSGLMRKDQTGELILDLAKSYEASKDGLSYTFTLKDNLVFHDGETLDSDDVVFTINQIKNPNTKSPKKANWDGISVEKIDDKSIKFTLKQPYFSFLENLTLGIIPEHLWKNSHIEINDLNINPIGSGPYKIKSVSKQSSGKINFYELTAFNKFALGKPYIKNITLRFYTSEDDMISALNKGEVSQISSLTPENAENLREKKYLIQSALLPRVFGLFLNQNQNQIFTNKHIVEAINKAIDKDKIITEVLSGYGIEIDDPIPPNMTNYQRLIKSNSITHEEKLAEAKKILEKNGWKIGESGYMEKSTVVKKKKNTTILEFSISTGNANELVKTADLIKKNLEELGIKVDVKTFEVGNLNQYVIRPRKYDTLLFGQLINKESDLFAFWHSSQRKDPGLNIAMYTNAKVDKILEDAFITIDEKARIKKYAQFEEEIRKDMPAIFLYSPKFIYLVSSKVKGINLNHVTSPSNRFDSAYLWYINTNNVWKVFSK